MRKYIITCLILPFCSISLAQSSHRLLLEGDEAYKEEKYDLAEEQYRRAIDKDQSTKGSFNLGNAIYQQDRYEEATQHYQNSAATAGNDETKGQALYNLGNAYVQAGQFNEAIDVYKQAVDLVEDADEIKRNLYLAKLMKREQQQQQQQEEQQNQQSNDENQNQEQQQQQQQEQNGDENQDQDQSSQSDQINNTPSESPSPSETQDMSREDAEKLLQVIENEEKNVQEKLRKVSGAKKKPAKDW